MQEDKSAARQWKERCSKTALGSNMALNSPPSLKRHRVLTSTNKHRMGPVIQHAVQTSSIRTDGGDGHAETSAPRLWRAGAGFGRPHAEPAAVTLQMAGGPMGWIRSNSTGRGTICNSLQVWPARRRCLAEAALALHDDAERGSWSARVLLIDQRSAL
ncbi:hypothetical protein SKAU_G00364550 [Synaphobranchus kaupii]|uniref:Uncharacterized protein n=1 Tax=Synaphobranchus kaupii TaxID=118154 RepID=A0A9Q1EEU7_SYNKA|nr:hypothetical protein SKAU_G00364550 [Synaphobranchus kaupii]